MANVTLALVAAVTAALVFNFMDGYVASSSLVATTMASGALGARQALIVASISEFLGPLIFGVAVAGTIGRDFVSTADLTLVNVVAMMAGAVLWLLITYRLGLPVSPSHALVGGMIGATVAASGWGAIYPAG